MRRYHYVGPADLHGRPATADAIAADSAAQLAEWLAARDDEPFTFVVAVDGGPRLAPRRSEHVALAAGQDVLAAGEMTCGERNVVRDGDFTCALCDGALPAEWNF